MNDRLDIVHALITAFDDRYFVPVLHDRCKQIRYGTPIQIERPLQRFMGTTDLDGIT
jgi:hypothetical protein